MTAEPTAFATPISIHALREESDLLLQVAPFVDKHFNPRSP